MQFALVPSASAIRLAAKIVLPRSYRNRLRHAYARYQLFRVAAAKAIAPQGCFVQHTPDFVRDLGGYPNFRKDLRWYIREYSLASAHLASDGTRLLQLHLLLKHVANLPHGDYAELGTHRGHSARLIFQQMADGAGLHCFDTFSGFTEADVRTESVASGVKTTAGHFGNTSLEVARRTVLGERSSERLKMYKGNFPDTFSGLENRAWRFVHLDADLFAPTAAGLEVFYPRLVPGGVLLLHDYNNSYAGVRRAVDAYFGKLGITPVPLADKSGSAVIVKARPPS